MSGERAMSEVMPGDAVVGHGGPATEDPQVPLTLRVGGYEGPLDLLLHLCRTEEIDLAALPVRTITDQYLTHLEAMDFRDLETAGAYLVMAATLIYLKSKLLVPPDETAAEEVDDEALALKQELEERLREYAQVKARGVLLAEREAEQALLWGRPGSTLPAAEDIPLEDLSVHLLERALRHLIDEQTRTKPREVEPNPPSVLDRMTEILVLLRDTWSMLFSSLAGGERRRSDVVVTLLAVLELVRQGRIRAQQTELFGEIVLERTHEANPAPVGTRGGSGFTPDPERGGLGGSVSAPPSG
jgi:segregation and condensation protein A